MRRRRRAAAGSFAALNEEPAPGLICALLGGASAFKQRGSLPDAKTAPPLAMSLGLLGAGAAPPSLWPGWRLLSARQVRRAALAAATPSQLPSLRGRWLRHAALAAAMPSQLPSCHPKRCTFCALQNFGLSDAPQAARKKRQAFCAPACFALQLLAALSCCQLSSALRPQLRACAELSGGALGTQL